MKITSMVAYWCNILVAIMIRLDQISLVGAEINETKNLQPPKYLKVEDTANRNILVNDMCFEPSRNNQTEYYVVTDHLGPENQWTLYCGRKRRSVYVSYSVALLLIRTNEIGLLYDLEPSDENIGGLTYLSLIVEKGYVINASSIRVDGKYVLIPVTDKQQTCVVAEYHIETPSVFFANCFVSSFPNYPSSSKEYTTWYVPIAHDAVCT